MQGTEFRVQGSCSRVQGAGWRVQGAGFRVQGSGFRVQGSGFRVQDSGFRVDGSTQTALVGREVKLSSVGGGPVADLYSPAPRQSAPVQEVACQKRKYAGVL